MAASRAQLVLKENDVFIVTDEAGHLPPGTSFGSIMRTPATSACSTTRLTAVTWNCSTPPAGRTTWASSTSPTTGTRCRRHEPAAPDDQPQPRTLCARRATRALHADQLQPLPRPLTFTVTCGADFRDMFDLRGFERTEWGTLRAPTWEHGLLTLGYDGLDGRYRATVIRFDPPPGSLDFHLPLGHETVETEPSIMCR